MFSCFVLLLPCFSSTCYQTNEGDTGNISVDFLSFSRTELLHHLLDAHVVHDEEDESTSSIFQIRRVNISLGSTSVQVLFSIGIVLGKEPAGSLLCGFALAFDRHAKTFALNF